MRIGIVNDLAMAREALRRAVVSVPGHEIAWLAVDGADAVAKARIDRPDLILMDLIMPVVDGVEATRRIMAESPCAIVVVTSSVRAHLGRVYEAMGLGALDAVDTPELGPSGDVSGARLMLDKIATVAKLLGRSPRVTSASDDPPSTPTPPPPGGSPSWPLIAIGCSTGGPAALAQILSALPESKDASVVIVQHVDSAFAPGLAEWLGERARRPVELIQPGDRPLPGKIMLAATNDHVILDEDRSLRYVAEPTTYHYRPSVDVFYQSLVRHWPEPGAAVLLTGMGRDGAIGLLALRRAGWLTIAQDEASSVVWGMPRAAVEISAAELVLPLSAIAASLLERVRDRSHRLPGDSRR
ncbi:chemotaxis-specific protein-glutamate methyltransferase CheB (plasmid) [Tundrisphaera lichenicola]|uniref:chemotaxis-specific protein-glutamate methyltransferase CheB n=1 Tax=Tundrisphaera lichenicola TaxID=2029860 RepID=UPI003EBED76F